MWFPLKQREAKQADPEMNDAILQNDRQEVRESDN